MNTVAELLAAAMQHHQAGRLQKAEGYYRQILSVEPNHSQALHLLGVIALQVGKSEVAIEFISRALQLQPQWAEAVSNLGSAFAAQAKAEEAITCFHQALKIDADFADAHYNLGTILADRTQLDEAISHFLRAADLNPGFASVHYNLGLAYMRRGELDLAIASYQKALELLPNFAGALNNLGMALAKKGALQEAEDCYRRALEQQPGLAEACLNLGAVLEEMERPDEAIAAYRRALKLNPSYADAHFNLGNVFREQGRLDEALACFRLAAEFNPDYVEAHHNQSQLLLLKGDFDRGWKEYEWRWRHNRVAPFHFTKPKWDGQGLAEKTIFIHAEQGLGDTIQFVRFVSILKGMGSTVIFGCQKQLYKLLRGFHDIDFLITEGDDIPPFDFHESLLSLPRILQTSLDSIPATVPYLFADESLVNQWREKLAGIAGFRVGINWQGRGGLRDSRKRDIPLDMFAALASLSGVQLISLQKGSGREPLLTANFRTPIIDFGEQLDDANGAFMDSAAIMMNLDLVITSDTSVAHLAGALGVPVWVALPFVPDWRWLLDRSDSPWYPTMRLFRQKRAGDWAGVFEEIEKALRERIS